MEDGSLAVPSGGTVVGEVHTIDSAELVRKLTHAKKVLQSRGLLYTASPLRARY